IAAGYGDSREAGAVYFNALGLSERRDHLRRTFLETGPAAIDYLTARSNVRLITAGVQPDYRSELPGAALAGRVVVSAPFDGRLLGGDFARVRPPIPEFTVLGGMMVSKADIAHLMRRFKSFKSFRYSAALLFRHLRDRL